MYRLQSLDKLLYPLFSVTNLQWCALFRVDLLGGVNVLITMSVGGTSDIALVPSNQIVSESHHSWSLDCSFCF